jgi:hypothetical protein
MNWEYFIAGCIGAIAPEILRLYQMRLAEEIKFSRFYFIISGLYILIGGYVASIFPIVEGQTPFWAMCIGIGLVTTINTMAKIAVTLNEVIKAGTGKGLESLSTQNESQAPGFEANKTARKSEKAVRNGSFWDFTRSL